MKTKNSDISPIVYKNSSVSCTNDRDKVKCRRKNGKYFFFILLAGVSNCTYISLAKCEVHHPHTQMSYFSRMYDGAIVEAVKIPNVRWSL